VAAWAELTNAFNRVFNRGGQKRIDRGQESIDRGQERIDRGQERVDRGQEREAGDGKIIEEEEVQAREELEERERVATD
jgi:hypothetical protein